MLPTDPITWLMVVIAAGAATATFAAAMWFFRQREALKKEIAAERARDIVQTKGLLEVTISAVSAQATLVGQRVDELKAEIYRDFVGNGAMEALAARLEAQIGTGFSHMRELQEAKWDLIERELGWLRQAREAEARRPRTSSTKSG